MKPATDKNVLGYLLHKIVGMIMNEFVEVSQERDKSVHTVQAKLSALSVLQEEFAQIDQWVKFVEQRGMDVATVKGHSRVQAIVQRLGEEEFANKFQAQDIAVW
jgi:hypothetical protein